MRQVIRFETLTNSEEEEDVVGVKITYADGTDDAYAAEEGDWPLTAMVEDAADRFAHDDVSFAAYDADWWVWFRDFVTGEPEPLPEPEPESEDPEPITEIGSELGSVEVSGDLETVGAEASSGIEIAGDITGSGAEMEAGDNSAKAASGTRKKKKKSTTRLREGAGCKQPDEVEGFMSGRLLCVTKRHRSTKGRDWGRCEYRVRCNEDGSYTLEYFAGNRGDVAAGDQWQTASIMFKALLAMPPETMHHKMTIKRYFKIK